MTELQVEAQLLEFDEDKRELHVLVVPWDVDVDKDGAVHRFARGAFKDIDPARLKLRSRHQDPPTGKAFELWDEDDGQHARFRVSKTAAGDEQLTLVKDGVEDGISVGFSDSKYVKQVLDNGRTRYTHVNFQGSKNLEASTTWRPTFPQARVLSFQESQEISAVADEPTTQAPEPAVDSVTPEMVKAFEENVAQRFEALQDRIAALGLTTPDSVKREAEGLQFARRVALGETMQDREVRAAFELDEVVSADNLGSIPEMRSSQIVGIIDSSRPFLESTTREPVPPAGETWKFPKITQRPTVAVQAAEKDEVDSTKTTITAVDFPMATYAGAGDLSIQLIKRSSPSFLDLWLRLLGEAYAIATDNAAVDDLLSETAVVEGVGAFDPASPSFGEAFQNAATAAGGRPALLPNRIWLSTAALVAFINAKSPTGGGGTPLYPGLAGISGITSGSGAGPAGFQMQPVWVPALDDEAVDLIIGPSQGFHWTEDGTYTLQADIPSKAGRDVGLVGMIWFAPIYPAAFTTYVLAS